MKGLWFVIFTKDDDDCFEFAQQGCIAEEVGNRLLIDPTGERYAMTLTDTEEFLSQNVLQFYATKEQMDDDITNGLSFRAKGAVRHIRHHLHLEWSA